jgi:hypothetical protein
MASVSQFIFGNSLVNYSEGGSFTNVPVWMNAFAQSSGHSYQGSGGYGFLRQFADRDVPASQWGFEGVNAAWDADTTPFAQAQLDSVIITPANFIQGETPGTDYYGDTRSPLDAAEQLVDRLVVEQPDAKIFVYQGWADLAPFSETMPPSDAAMESYHSYNMTGYRAWYEDFVNQINAADPDADVQLLPVASILSELLTTVLSDVPAEALYVDSAPHGTETLYFLASMVTYTASYGEAPTLPDVLPVQIHPSVLQNFDAASDLILTRLEEAGVVDSDATPADPDLPDTGGETPDPEPQEPEPNPEPLVVPEPENPNTPDTGGSSGGVTITGGVGISNGAVTPAQPEEPNTPPEPTAPETPTQPSEPEAPSEPQEPDQPEPPAEPDAPAQPETPVQPNPPAPSEPETPAEPVSPEPTEPDTPAEPEQPSEPEPTAEPETPSEPSTPTPPAEPEQPQPVVVPDAPIISGASGGVSIMGGVGFTQGFGTTSTQADTQASDPAPENLFELLSLDPAQLDATAEETKETDSPESDEIAAQWF